MNYFSFITPLMVITTGLWDSPIVFIGYDYCTEAMLNRLQKGSESMAEYERCLKKNNYFIDADVIRWEHRYRRYR